MGTKKSKFHARSTFLSSYPRFRSLRLCSCSVIRFFHREKAPYDLFSIYRDKREQQWSQHAWRNRFCSLLFRIMYSLCLGWRAGGWVGGCFVVVWGVPISIPILLLRPVRLHTSSHPCHEKWKMAIQGLIWIANGLETSELSSGISHNFLIRLSFDGITRQKFVWRTQCNGLCLVVDLREPCYKEIERKTFWFPAP